MACGYKNKGCSKGEACGKSYDDCALAKYFDSLIERSDECRSNGVSAKRYVAMWRMRKPIDDRCEGCGKVTETGYCRSFIFPSARWPEGEPSFENKCVLSDHMKPAVKKKFGFVNPIKASKRGMGRR